jgi:hypothetical protein
LEVIALGIFEAVDALLTENDASGLTLPEELGLGHVTAGDFEIFKSDVG